MAETRPYNPKDIDAKWQKFWDQNKTYAAPDKKGDKFYGLVEFPYPSGDGLHTGHLRSYTALDVISRKKRMEGKNVLYPMGFDAFGLPAENFAIKTNTPPELTTKKNIANYVKQMKSIGLSFDWDRSFSTTDPEYYKWTQWIFIQMFKKGLAYKSVENINWCTSCQIGLANEEVVGGVCERCGGKVIKKEKEQWLLKITEYADRLIEDLDKVDFLEAIKKQQKDWIGRSEGAEVDFKIKDSDEILKVFTTRPDTLFGATFMVLAPEHPSVKVLKDKISNFTEIEKYIDSAKAKTDEERGADDKEKTGVELKGIKAINPVNNQEIPIFIADYIMMAYGTGAIMAVPAHDQRDFDFAKKYNLEIREVVEPLFSKTTGDDAFRENEKIIERDAAVCVVKHWQEEKYLCLQWKNVDWHGLIVGGIEKGEDLIEAAKREIEEETGYTSAKFIKNLGGIVHAQFYQTLKKENRRAHFHGVYFELENDKNLGISEKEQAIHDVKWIDKNQVETFLNVPDMKLIWRRVYNDEAYSGNGIAINSGEFDGLETAEFKEKIIEWLEKNKLGKKTVNYKLHDWIFSRQRYWGEPIPMVNCPKCGWVPVADKDLPVELPKVKDFKPGENGESPLAKIDEWVNIACPKCGGEARRETDVMPNWAGSNWYFVRYCDPKNNKELVDKKKAAMWLPVDWYNGGMEHTTLHLLYSRFIFKFLYDIGVIPKSVGSEPYKKRTAQGMILGEGGIKMSKSKGNVINPDDYVAEYGADTLRVYEMFMGPFDQSIAWDDKGVKGVNRFLNKIHRYVNSVYVDENSPIRNVSITQKKINILLNKTIKKVTEDIDNMRFNTAISQLMVLFNELYKEQGGPIGTNTIGSAPLGASSITRIAISRKDLEKFILLLSPFAPHLAEELWNSLGHKDSLAHESWPKYDEKLARDENIVIGIQINGKVRDEIELPAGTEPGEEVKKQILSKDKIKKYTDGKEIVKFIHIKDRIISIVVK